ARLLRPVPTSAITKSLALIVWMVGCHPTGWWKRRRKRSTTTTGGLVQQRTSDGTSWGRFRSSTTYWPVPLWSLLPDGRPPVSDLTDSTLFKALDGLRPVHGGDGRYPDVGQWTEHLDPQQLEPCVYGYHLTRGPQVLGWLGPTLYVAEACPDHPPVDDGNKLVTCRVRLVRRLDRWDETSARLFAADCAEAALLGERASGREPDERS